MVGSRPRIDGNDRNDGHGFRRRSRVFLKSCTLYGVALLRVSLVRPRCRLGRVSVYSPVAANHNARRRRCHTPLMADYGDENGIDIGPDPSRNARADTQDRAPNKLSLYNDGVCRRRPCVRTGRTSIAHFGHGPVLGQAKNKKQTNTGKYRLVRFSNNIDVRIGKTI